LPGQGMVQTSWNALDTSRMSMFPKPAVVKLLGVQRHRAE
jgi:hypothetical protein